MSDVQSATSPGYTRGLGNTVRGFNLQFSCLHRKWGTDVFKVHFPVSWVYAAYKLQHHFLACLLLWYSTKKGNTILNIKYIQHSTFIESRGLFLCLVSNIIKEFDMSLKSTSRHLPMPRLSIWWLTMDPYLYQDTQCWLCFLIFAFA